MSTSRPFAYSPETQVPGTEQLGDLSIGTPFSGFTDNPQYWNGPDEELGYVIAQSVPDNSQPTPIEGVFASVGFYRSEFLTESSFVELTNQSFNQSFTDGTSAKTWLNDNGYWTSYDLINPTPTPTGTPGETTTPTPSETPTQTPTTTTTLTATPTQTETSTPTPTTTTTLTSTPTSTQTPTETSTPTPTGTPISTETPTPTQTPTTTTTLTSTPTQTETSTPTPTQTPTTTTTLTSTPTQTQTQTPTTTTTLTSTPTQTPTNTPTSTPTYSGVCNTYYFGIDTFPGESTTFGYYEFPSGTYTQINIISPDAIFVNAYSYPGVFYVNGDTGYTIENYGPCGPTPTPTATNTPTPTNTPTNTRTPTPTSTTSLLSWSFVRDSGTGTYNLYINGVNVEARSSTSNGFITVSVGDEIYVNAFAGSCAGGTANANLAVTGIIIDGACQASSVSLTTSTYTVTSANIGQTIVLSTLAQCLNECL
jgi:hypothetical protein